MGPRRERGAENVIFRVYVSVGTDCFSRWCDFGGRVQGAEPGCTIILCANKCDIPQDQWEVTLEEAQRYADQEGMQFFQSSASKQINVTEVTNETRRDAHDLGLGAGGCSRETLVCRCTRLLRGLCSRRRKTKSSSCERANFARR